MRKMSRFNLSSSESESDESAIVSERSCSSQDQDVINRKRKLSGESLSESEKSVVESDDSSISFDFSRKRKLSNESVSDPFSSEDEADPDDNLISLADTRNRERSDASGDDEVSRVPDSPDTTLTTAVPNDGTRIADATDNDIADNYATIPLRGYSSDSDSLSLCLDSPPGSILSFDSSVCNSENSRDSISIGNALSDTDDSEDDALYPNSKITSAHFDALLLGFFKGAVSRYCTVTLKSLKLPMHQWKP